MIIKNHKPTFKSVFSVAFILGFAILLQSCAQKIAFTNSTVVPAAEGFVKVKQDNNNNYNIDLNVMRLAEASRLSPPKQMYIVWMVTEGNGTKNIGQLNTSGSLFSKNLRSSLKTVSAFKPTKIYITAEDDASIQYSSGQTVLSTDNF